MKSLIILVLLVISCGGAFLSKPSEASFRDMVQKKMDSEGKDGLVGTLFRGGKSRSEAYLAACKYQDRLLFATVERDGKKIYTGAFSTWFENSAEGGVPKIEKK